MNDKTEEEEKEKDEKSVKTEKQNSPMKEIKTAM